VVMRAPPCSTDSPGSSWLMPASVGDLAGVGC
jgi:hypothetical protein